jgi:hypothetical protein
MTTEHDAAFEAALPGLAHRLLNQNERIFYTKWKDGIDIEYPTLQIERFARAIFDAAWNARGEADARVCEGTYGVNVALDDEEAYYGRQMAVAIRGMK